MDQINPERIEETFKSLVRINSPSGMERKVADFVAEQIGKFGFDVNEDDAGRHILSNRGETQEAISSKRPTGNLICRKKGTVKAPALLFSAHLDTVLPNEGVKIEESDGYLHTDGKTILGADDKAGIAAMLEAAQVLWEKKIPHPDLEFIFTVSEETGLDGSRLLDEKTLSAKVGFVLDSGGPPDEIIYTAPYETDYDILIKGKAAHSGVNPEDGISAIAVAADAIHNLKMGRIDEETTVNIGIISGGKQTNIVCDEVRVVGEARSRSKDKLTVQLAKVRTAFQYACEKWKATCDMKEMPIYEGFSLTDEDQVISLAKTGCKKIGLTPKLVPRGGGSDTNVYNAKGIPSVNLGVGAQHDHTVDERIEIEHLHLAARLVLAIIDASMNGDESTNAEKSGSDAQADREKEPTSTAAYVL